MIVKRYEFDQEKLNRMVEKKEMYYLAMQRLSDRRQAANQSLQRARGNLQRWTNKNRGDTPTQLTEAVERYRAEHDAVAAEYERATERWREFSEIVTPLEEAAIEWRGQYGGTSVINVTGTGQRETTRAALFPAGGI